MVGLCDFYAFENDRGINGSRNCHFTIGMDFAVLQLNTPSWNTKELLNLQVA